VETTSFRPGRDDPAAGARNEAVGFQSIWKAGGGGRSRLSFPEHHLLKPRVYEFGYVKIVDKKGRPIGSCRTPLFP